MGASNFHKTQASKYYAICMNYEDEIGETVQAEGWEYTDMRLCVENEIEERGLNFTPTSQRDEHELHSYPSRVIGIVSKGEVELMLTTRAGYHEGACLDWHELSDISDADDEIAYASDLKILSSEVENVYEQLSTPMNRVSTFSNGESIYKK